MIEYVEGERLDIPILDVDRCQFAAWSKRFIQKHSQFSQEISQVNAIHAKMHILAESLINSAQELSENEKKLLIKQMLELKESLVLVVLKLVNQ